MGGFRGGTRDGGGKVGRCAALLGSSLVVVVVAEAAAGEKDEEALVAAEADVKGERTDAGFAPVSSSFSAAPKKLSACSRSILRLDFTSSLGLFFILVFCFVFFFVGGSFS